MKGIGKVGSRRTLSQWRFGQMTDLKCWGGGGQPMTSEGRTGSKDFRRGDKSKDDLLSVFA